MEVSEMTKLKKNELSKEMILATAKRKAKEQGKFLSSGVKWFSPEQVELVKMPDKRVGWVVGKDCETLRIVMPIDNNRIHLFDQDEISSAVNEREQSPRDYMLVDPIVEQPARACQY